MRALIAVLTVLTVLTGSTACSHEDEPTVDLYGLWLLTSAKIGDSSFTGSLVPAASLVIFRDGTGSASTGCSNADVSVEAHGRKVAFTVSELNSQFGCSDGKELEGVFEDALGNTHAATVTGDALVLNGPSIELRFERSATEPHL